MIYMKLTPRQALDIQARQVANYGQWVPDLAAKVAAITNIPEGTDLDVPLEILEIDAMIPRGWDIEQIYVDYRYSLHVAAQA